MVSVRYSEAEFRELLDVLSDIVVHDPDLAHRVHEAALTTWGLRNKNYHKFMAMVRELASILGIRFVNPYDGTRKHSITLTVKVPRVLADIYNFLAAKAGIPRSVLVRLALAWFLTEFLTGDRLEDGVIQD